jgi:hypothetical protein
VIDQAESPFADVPYSYRQNDRDEALRVIPTTNHASKGHLLFPTRDVNIPDTYDILPQWTAPKTNFRNSPRWNFIR